MSTPDALDNQNQGEWNQEEAERCWKDIWKFQAGSKRGMVGRTKRTTREKTVRGEIHQYWKEKEENKRKGRK